MYLHHFLQELEPDESAKRMFDEYLAQADAWRYYSTHEGFWLTPRIHGDGLYDRRIRNYFYKAARSARSERVYPYEKILVSFRTNEAHLVNKENVGSIVDELMRLMGIPSRSRFWCFNVIGGFPSLFVFFCVNDHRAAQNPDFDLSTTKLNQITKGLAAFTGASARKQTKKQVAEKQTPRALIEKRFADEVERIDSKSKLRTLADRRGLPFVLPPCVEMDQNSPSLVPDEFSLVEDAVLNAKVRESFVNGHFLQITNDISKLFDCESFNIAFMERLVAIHWGDKKNVVRFRCEFNRSFIDAVKSCQAARYSKPGHSWTIALSDWPVVSANLKKALHVIIDTTTGQIFRSNVRHEYELHPPHPDNFAAPSFKPLPYHIEIDVDRMVSDLWSEDYEAVENLKIFDGESCVWVARKSTIWTRMPFLLATATRNGTPIGATYSTLGLIQELSEFQVFHLQLAAMRCRDSCRTATIRAFSPSNQWIIKEQSGDRERYHGDFRQYEHAIRHICNQIPDIEIAFLSQDYVTSYLDRYGASADATELAAYVTPGHSTFYQSVASYFGYSKSCYPIIFIHKNGVLDDDAAKFKELTAHELAHLLADEEDSPLRKCRTGHHSLHWAVFADVLTYIFADPTDIFVTHIYSYMDDPENADLGMSDEEIEIVFKKSVMPLIDEHRSEGRPFNKVDIQAFAVSYYADVIRFRDDLRAVEKGGASVSSDADQDDAFDLVLKNG